MAKDRSKPYHENERNEGEHSDRAAEPNDFSVCLSSLAVSSKFWRSKKWTDDQYDGQIFENRIDRYTEVLLERMSALFQIDIAAYQAL